MTEGISGQDQLIFSPTGGREVFVLTDKPQGNLEHFFKGREAQPVICAEGWEEMWSIAW